MRSILKPTGLFLLFLFLSSLQILPRIAGDSLTSDEPTDITNGYYYLTHGDVVTPHNHPPLASALNALPLLFLDLKALPWTGDVMDRAHQFLFQWNLDKLDKITFASRIVSWLLGCGIGFLLFLASRKDKTALFFTLFFWAMDPILSALSGLAKTDIAPTFFIFLAVLLFQKALERPGWKVSLAAGVVSGLAVACKFYGLVLIPLFLALEYLNARSKGPKAGGRRWGLGLAGFVSVLFLLYLPATLMLTDHLNPFSYLFSKFKENLLYAQDPHPTYFLGASSLQNHWAYFPAAFLLKEPIPFLLLLFVSLALAFRKKIAFPSWQWMPPLFLFLAILPAPNLGVRYLLPAFPFLFLMAGRGAGWIREKAGHLKGWKMALTGLVLWQSASVLASYPGSLSYFNEWVSSERKIQYLGDSNLDWGQDLKRLAAAAKERKWGTVRLAYLGAVDPEVYGIAWTPWSQEDLKGPQPGRVYAVNAGFLQLAPAAYPSTRTIAESWIQHIPPTGRVADSWYYFEIPGKAADGIGKERFLPSAPFLQYRGYRVFAPSL